MNDEEFNLESLIVGAIGGMLAGLVIYVVVEFLILVWNWMWT